MYAVPMYDGDHPIIIRTCISVLLVAASLVCELFDAKLKKMVRRFTTPLNYPRLMFLIVEQGVAYVKCRRRPQDSTGRAYW